MEDALAIVAQFSIALFLLVPLAAAFRAAAVHSHVPLTTILLALTTGILSFPVVLWFIQIATWLVRAGFWLLSRFREIVAWVVELLDAIRMPLALIFFLLLLGGFTILVLKSSHVWRNLFIAAAVALVAFGLISVFGDSLASILASVSAALSWVGSILIIVGLVAVVIVSVAVVTVLAIGLLTQIGITFILPVAVASRAGESRADGIDFAAGSGVGISTILTAASVSPGFHEWFTDALSRGPLGEYLGQLPVTFLLLLPDGFEDALHYAFRGFSGLPEFAILAITCFLASASLLLAGRTYEGDKPSHLARLAVLRTAVGLVLILPLTLISAAFSADTT